MKRVPARIVAAACAAIALVAAQPCCAREAVEAFGGNGYSDRLVLVDGHRQPVALRELRGRALVVYFGFTFCPDVCPTTLNKVVEATRNLEDRLTVVFITLDPQRDRQPALQEYANFFSPSIVALGGNDRQIGAAVRQFGVYRHKVRGQTRRSYTIDHSSYVYLIDQEGRLRLRLAESLSSEALRAEFLRFLDQPGN